MSERLKPVTAVLSMLLLATLGGLATMLVPKLSQAATDWSYRDVTIRKICKPKQIVSDKPQLVEKPGGDNVTLLSGDTGVDFHILSLFEYIAAYSWSPDGSSITYSSDGIYTVGATGENRRRIAGPNVMFRDPAWSPDGSTIAYKDVSDPNRYTFIFKDLNTGATLGSAEVSSTDQTQPSWTADSRFLVTPAIGPGEQGIYFVNRGNGTVSSISMEDEDIDVIGAVSTGGVVYFWGVSYSDDWAEDDDSLFSGYNIFSTRGGGAVTSISNGGSDRSMVLSPDGRRIAYTSDRDEGAWNSDIYLMDIDGRNRVKLTDNGRRNFEPTWSPDGTKIAFISTEEDNMFSSDIYWMEVSPGSPQHNLTADNDGGDIYLNPIWSPDGKRIAFVSDRGSVDSNGDGVEDPGFRLYTMGAPRTDFVYTVREGKRCRDVVTVRRWWERDSRPPREREAKPAKARTIKAKATNPKRKVTSKRPSKRKKKTRTR